MARLERVDLGKARAALGEARSRLTALLRMVERPETPALGQWDVVELATHLSHAFDVMPGLAGRTRPSCHLLNETVVHGYDIARAVGQPWLIDPSHAALIFQGFLLELFQALPPRTFVIQEKAAGLRACYEIRLRGAGRFLVVLEDGAMTVEAPSSRRVDCHLSADPVAFLLVAWARTSQWRAISKGQLVAWGRRPWLGVQLRVLLRSP